MNYIDIIGIIASVASIIAFLPQIYKIYKTKSAADLSLIMLLNLFICALAWIVYGILIGSSYLIITNGIVLSFQCVLLGQKFYFRKNNLPNFY